MADALPLTPLPLIVLLIAVAAAPATAEPRMSDWKLQAVEAGSFDRPARTRHDPVLGPVLGLRFFEEEIILTWTPPFGPRAGERDRRGLTFIVRPTDGLKATAKIRF
jgi:hypothetical protein